MKNNKGFSLVELIIVVAIMAVLMGVLAPQYLRYLEKTRIRVDDRVVDAVLDAASAALMDEKLYNKVSTLPTIQILQGGLIEISGMVSENPDANEILKNEIYTSVYGVTDESKIEDPFKSKAYKTALKSGPIELEFTYDPEVMSFILKVHNAPEGSAYNK